MRVDTYNDVEELAKQTVLHAMRANPGDDLFGIQTEDSVFYQVYNDLANKNTAMGSFFAIHLKDVYEIDILIK